MKLILQHKLKSFFRAFGIIAIILTLIPFIALDYWWIRMFDFPHLQLTFLTLFAIIIYFIKFEFKNYKDYIFVLMLVSCMVYQFMKIYPYTLFAKFEVLNSTPKSTKNITLFTANVLQENTETKKLIKQVKLNNADVLLFTEVNTYWLDAITSELPEDYKYRVEFPLENTYGMALYSKLKLINPTIHFLVNDSIPSIHSQLALNSKDTIQVYAIHPTPPMPQENPLSTDRDSEMMQIAFKSRASKYPTVVIGDFNDVAWSETSKLFQKVSGLLDIRKGRGLFNTYNAKNPILRWPLDHVFVSKEFRFKSAKLCEHINSDHFPFFAELSLEPKLAYKQQPVAATKDEIETAKKQIDKELKQ